MLIKEYRIPLPMSLEEYQVAQLYMIQKKSREESSGEGSGVEILANRPYTDGPGGSGQYTHKIYHVGSHIPSWFRALLPKAALQVEEESWNAYPYTRTRYTCPFVEKFSIDIETFYKPDCGDQSNVFNLSSAEKRQRIVDILDLVKDPISPNEYKTDEDPKLYRSTKTGRGPLNEEWLEEAKRSTSRTPIMCAYKLCKVEFRYWGMQSKIEQFIHDVGLRKVMLRAHRQAWCWQDEWCDLTMEDIRQLEEETAMMLAQKMAKFAEPNQVELTPASPEVSDRNGGLVEAGNKVVDKNGRDVSTAEDGLTKQWSTSSRSSHSSQHAGGVSPQSFSEWRMQNIARDSENSSEDEFFDAHEDFSDSDEVFSKEITKWNSSDFIDKFETVGESEENQGELPSVRRSFSREGLRTAAAFPESGSMESVSEGCKIHVLILILHGGNILDKSGGDHNSKQGDIHTLSSAFDTVMRLHFPEALGHIALRLVPCPPVCAEAYCLVSNLSPYSYDGDCLSSSQDHIPLAALPLLATSSLHYQDAVSTVIARANQAYHDFLRTKEGISFRGQVVLIGDCVGGILGFDALCHTGVVGLGSRESSRRGSMNNDLLSPGIYIGKDPLSDTSLEASKAISKSSSDVSGCGGAEPEQQLARKRSDNSTNEMDSVKQHQAFLSSLQASVMKGDPENRRTSNSSAAESECAGKLDFEVTDFFLFGSPLGLVLALRKTVMPTLDVSHCRPACQQIYNLFHSADPSASRLEPLLCKTFHAVPPFSVPRYQKYPLGDGSSALLADTLQTHASLFMDNLDVAPVITPGAGFGGFWRTNEVNVSCDVTGSTGSTNDIVKIIEKWWGTKRTDYALYCPDALTAFPTVTLPHLFHASYWESTDVVAFMLRQFIRHENKAPSDYEEASIYSPPIPQEKWQRKRTQVKIRNVTANHRANDAIVLEGGLQVLSGRFMYGPLDVVTLTGEKVDIYIMTQPPGGKWIHFGTETTNSSGRISFIIPEEKRLGIGMYPVRMVVRGDHTFSECSLTVVPHGTECVVFSIDGSFAASVSIMGSDPKVRAGAVDIVRHWQDLGYVIVYVTGRPDMQKQKVVAWLAQHNFPHGVVSFCDGLTHDPLRQKAAFLQSLIQEVEMKIEAAYGSAKDVSVYSSLGLAQHQVYIVGRPSKKFQNQCQFLSEGYVAHLAQLEMTKHSRASKGSGRFVMGKGSFGRPVQTDFLRKQSQLFRSRHPTAPDRSPSQLERDGEPGPSSGTGGSSVKYKSRSVSLKLENDV